MDERLDEDGQTQDLESAAKFKLLSEKYAFQSPSSSPTRRPGKPNTEVVIPHSRASSPRKRKPTETEDIVSPEKAKRKRGYAPPETYSHLNYLTDCLAMNLEVMFCGINPGVLSAKVGHHFAHPTNQFYRMLHGSGLTDRLIPPKEDITLPKLYSLGITDLVDRPSASADELSDKEMIESVPVLLEKIALWKPRIVCFVGKGMWLNAEKGIKRILKEKQHSTKDKVDTWSSSPKKRLKQGKAAGSQVSLEQLSENSGVRREYFDLGFGLRPYKIVHPVSDGSEDSVHESLFFCSPSSSGLVTSMNLAKKVELYKLLRENVQQLKAGTIDTSWMMVMPV